MTTVFPTATITGYPRIGARRELKRAVEAYWAGKSDQNELKQTAQKIQQDAYRTLTGCGLTDDYAIPADFSFYDQVLDTTRLFTALPARFESVRDDRGLIDLDGYFALARGTEHLPPLELTKWFDTNYHYLVPEIGPTTGFTLNTEALDDLLAVAEAAGTSARPSITGPLTYLLLAKAEDGAPRRLRTPRPSSRPAAPLPGSARPPGWPRCALGSVQRARPGCRSGCE